MQNNSRSRATSTVTNWFLNRSELLAAALVAVLLAAPGMRFAYLFDDYNFLESVQRFHVGSLFPDPAALFYRPISREIYFALLDHIFPDSPVAGHLANAALVATLVVLGGALAGRLAGARAGIIAAFLIATFAHWPVLVAWVSGSQDLLAIAFAIAAINLELSGRGIASTLLFACSVLSKETAIVLAPALVAARWLRPSSRRDLSLAAARVGIVVAIWALVHPGLRMLVAQGGVGPPGSYIGFDGSQFLVSLVRFVPVALNLPAIGFKVHWPGELLWALVAAAAPMALVLSSLRPKRAITEEQPLEFRERARRITAFAVLLGVPPLVLTALVVRHWAPYYICFSTIGMSIALSPWLARLPFRNLAILLVAYVALGFWSRGIELTTGMPSERNLAPAGKALARLEENFKRVAPSLPPESKVYVTIRAHGTRSVYIHLHGFQALRVWYREPTIETLRPELRVVSGGPEYFFVVDRDLNVFNIDVHSFSVGSVSGPLDPEIYRSALTSYAVGLAGSGDIERAVDILLHLSSSDTWQHLADRRIAAMLLLANGEHALADTLLSGIPPFPRPEALQHVGVILTMPDRGNHLEVPAMKAFGLSPDDPVPVRLLMRSLLNYGYVDVAERLALRLSSLRPGDREAAQALQTIRARNRPAGPQIMAPVRTLEFPKEGRIR